MTSSTLMETISTLPALCARNSPFPGALIFSLICTRINGWVNNHEAGDLRHNRTHYDVTVMILTNRSARPSPRAQVTTWHVAHYWDHYRGAPSLGQVTATRWQIPQWVVVPITHLPWAKGSHFRCIFHEWKVLYSIIISLKIVHDNKSALVQVMAWCRTVNYIHSYSGGVWKERRYMLLYANTKLRTHTKSRLTNFTLLVVGL